MRRLRNKKLNSMKKIFIEIWLPYEDIVNIESIGTALGKAIMTNNLTYIEETIYLNQFYSNKENNQERGSE